MPDLRDLVGVPVVQAPMAGGPGTVALATAVCEAGGIGFLAGGYRAAGELAAEIDELRRATTAPFGVNVFVPRAGSVDGEALTAYLAQLEPEAALLGVELGEASWDDDGWAEKLEVLLDARVPIASFTFGCPPAPTITSLRAAGTVVMVTVADPVEAEAARDAGADALCVQGSSAGGHRGSWTDAGGPALDTLDLVHAVRGVVDLPLVAAGGLMTARDVAGVRAAGAVGAQLGTAFLRCPESGTSELHRRALVDPRFSTTGLTRAFSGRTARGLVNRMMTDHPAAPVAYPHVNNATKPLRRAAVARGDADRTNLWAGRNFRSGSDEPAGALVRRLAAELDER